MGSLSLCCSKASGGGSNLVCPSLRSKLLFSNSLQLCVSDENDPNKYLKIIGCLVFNEVAVRLACFRRVRLFVEV